MPLLDDYMPDQELCEEMNVKPRTTKSWRDNRTGPPVTYISGRPYYRREAVRNWLLSRENQPLRKRRRRAG